MLQFIGFTAVLVVTVSTRSILSPHKSAPTADPPPAWVQYDHNFPSKTYLDKLRNERLKATEKERNAFAVSYGNFDVNYDELEPPLALPSGELTPGEEVLTEADTYRDDYELYAPEDNDSNRIPIDKYKFNPVKDWIDSILKPVTGVEKTIQMSQALEGSRKIKRLPPENENEVKKIQIVSADPVLRNSRGKLYNAIKTLEKTAYHIGESGNEVLMEGEKAPADIQSQLGTTRAPADAHIQHEDQAEGHKPDLPQVARIQDRGVDYPRPPTAPPDTEEEWSLPPWDPADTPVATAVLGSVMLFLISVIVVLALRVHCRNRNLEWGGRSPRLTPLLSTDQGRLKTKGLLERRGSNTSLTLELGSDPPPGDHQCSPEYFLMTAKKCLGRKSLKDTLKNPGRLHEEFWSIPTGQPDKSRVPGSASKNRYRTVLPREASRVVLGADPEDPNSYMNANYVKGYGGEEKCYIATQGPLPNTVGDLWRMVVQERACCVVMITRLREKGRLKCEPYLPSYSGCYGGVTVTVTNVSSRNGYTVRKLQLQRGAEHHTTLHFWFTGWSDHRTPSSARQLLAMAEEVAAAKEENGGPAVVHCSAGIGRTGCFIGLSIGVRQFREEKEVDLLGTVCRMRVDRGGMVQTAEQYEFLHRALALYGASLPSDG